MKKDSLLLWFKDIGIEDTALVGGKNSSLGEMYRFLTTKGVAVPNGFAVTAAAYRGFLKDAGIELQLKSVLSGLNVKDVADLAERGHRARDLIRKSELPESLKKEIVSAYHALSALYKQSNTDVAVRSSATAEDLPGASFAGQQETYLNIRGEAALLAACKDCFASLFTNRAIAYREEMKFDHLSVALSVGVQKMVRSDKACSGVMFTIDTESGFKDVVLINATYGLGENIVQGKVNPDEFYVFKPTLKDGKRPILSRKVGEKKLRMIYGSGVHATTRNVEVPMHERKRLCITDEEVLMLARWGMQIEEYYTQKSGKFTPMDIEWAKDGLLNKLFIVQARPETIHSRKDYTILERYVLKGKGKLIATGSSVGEKIGLGRAHVIKDARDIRKFRPGEVLVTEMTDPDWVPIMRVASAIVTNRGGRSSHAAIVSRELGLPCVVGTNTGTEAIRSGQSITVSCAEGEVGNVYEGLLKFDVQKVDLKQIPATKTRIMMNIGSPKEAFDYRFLPNKGVGLAREEFIINSYIKVHPLALVEFDALQDAEAKRLIEDITYNYKDKKQFFIEKLAEGVGTIAAAFYPHDVIVRLSDFKSNEYANLIGGKQFEPKEANPMIGWRGAARYYSSRYRKAFALECIALRKVREEMGLTNLKVMVPMCRTVEEGTRVLKEMEAHGLARGKHGLEVYVMCEIPSNALLADGFCNIFDGFSIGSNDLTQLTLGLDRDSELVSYLFDERNEAVKRLITEVIRAAKKHHRKIGICGQAPSDMPDFTEFLVERGIDSISLNPDSVLKMTLVVAKKERALAKGRET